MSNKSVCWNVSMHVSILTMERFGVLRVLFISFVFCLPLAIPAAIQAAELEQAQREGEQKIQENLQSQKRIDKIVESAQERLILYRSLTKQIEGLETYNRQLSTQVAGQKNLIARFDTSIAQVAQIERQMSPLLEKMLSALRQFVALDLPFDTAERNERLALLADSQAAADVDVAEKFRQLIEAYQIENEYGRKLDTWQDIVLLAGNEHEVDILRVGRIVLVCQTRDAELTAWWNHEQKEWQLLDPLTYRNAVRQGIRMVKKQASINIVTLPVLAAETVE